MKRSGAIWLVLGVVAVAALLMYFVVLPQVRDGKTVQDIAKQAEETVNDVKQTVNEAAKQVGDVADGAQELQAAAFAKVARIGQDAKGAADELKALLEKGTPSAEELAAAKAKLAAALKSAAEFKLPADAGEVATAVAAKVAESGTAALAALDSLPADPAAAKAALADIEARIMAALPGGDPAAPADGTKPVASDDGAAVQDTKPVDKKADAAAPADEAKPADEAGAVIPAFDVLRVEKDGSTVIAGRAAPDARIDVIDGDKVIASTQAQPSGDFVAILDNPLSAGDHSIVLKATTKDGKSSTSEEVATVSVPADGSAELLAMVTKPGEASRIIAAPQAKEETTEVASKSVTPDASEEKTTADATAPADADPAKAATQDVAKADAPAKAADLAAATPDLPADSADIASTPPVVAQDQAQAQDPAQESATADAGQQQVAKVEPVPAEENTSVTPADAGQTEQTQATATPEVMVSAVELEGDKIYVAGSTQPGATVRIYADDQIVAEAKADDGGRFVADGTIKLAVGDHTIRADVLSADGTKVAFRASVPFFRPEGDVAVVAGNDPAKTVDAAESVANAALAKARDEAGKALGLLQGLYAGGQMPTAEELAAARSSAEIALKSLADTPVAADVDPAVAAVASKAAEDAGKALDRLKAVPADVAAFKSALSDVEAIVGSVVKPATEVASADDTNKIASEAAAKDMATDKARLAAEADKPAEVAMSSDTLGDASKSIDAAQQVDKAGDQVSSNDVQVTTKVDRLKAADATANDQAAAQPVDATGQSGDQSATQQTASADQPKVIEQAPLQQSASSVIIRRGDTLWQISRRIYGKGVRYTTIYVANQAQIEDPDRIKPGQIFSMPGKWLDNAEELHKERLNHHNKP